jgi:uncharacterized protein with FMN-binding domain
MDIKETGKKIKPFAPVLSVALITACVAGSLSGYQAPVYAAQEISKSIKEDTQEEEQKAVGHFELEDGVYKGTGTGFAGDITVSVQIQDKQIVSIDIISFSDDEAFFTRAKAVIDIIIEGQTLDVDTVSGATFSSRGIINAVKNALTGEKDSNETGQAQSGGAAAAGRTTSVTTVKEPDSYIDGIYYGIGTGFGGPLKVKVEISGGKITSIQIVENSDGSSYISKASAVISSILSKQSTNVDTVSGATYSSVGIIQAVRNALSQAAVSGSSTGNIVPDNNSGSSEDSSVIGTVPYKEGIYYGTGEGYNGDVSVAVVIQEHTMKAILITEKSDDDAFFNRAMEVVKKVIRTQKTDGVDAVSGATYSSNGILEAIRNALKQAEMATNGEMIEEKPDVTELKSVIEKAEGLEKTKYTELSWVVLSIRLADAKEALEAVSQTEVDKAAERLKTAIAQLTSKDGKEEENTKYISGSYEVTVPCTPDEDGDFESYHLTMTVEIRGDKIVGITNVSGDGDSENDSYIKKAVNGTKSAKGVVEQILEKGILEADDRVDAVTHATCSSDAIIEGCKAALEAAKRPAETEAE